MAQTFILALMLQPWAPHTLYPQGAEEGVNIDMLEEEDMDWEDEEECRQGHPKPKPLAVGSQSEDKGPKRIPACRKTQTAVGQGFIRVFVRVPQVFCLSV